MFQNGEPMNVLDKPQDKASHRLREVVGRHSVAAYFALTFAISWLGALAVAAPALLRGEALPKMAGLMMFPVMLTGPSVASIALTAITGGRNRLRDLLARMKRWRVGIWYSALLVPPILVLSVLFALKTLVSPIYSPNRFFIGVSFGVLAGFFEEMGWMGFAFPAMRATLRSPLMAAVILGLFWGLWHLPVIDYLGTATPHGRSLIPYSLAFIAAMTAMRALIAWMYTNTESVLLAQLMHVSSTGSLVAFSPSRVSAGQETMWYAVYACALWMVVGLVVLKNGARLRRVPRLPA